MEKSISTRYVRKSLVLRFFKLASIPYRIEDDQVLLLTLL